MNDLTVLSHQSVRDIARGAAVLSTGGGGDPYIGRLMAEQAIADNGPVALIDPADLPDEAFVILVGMIGAPAVIVEKLPAADQATQVLAAAAAYLGRPLTHIGCIEAGGINSMIPIAAAARARLPLIDADGMGRAFPEIQMLLPTLEGIPATPMILADEKGNTLIINAIDNHWSEQFARPATVQMGGSAMMALYPMSGRQIKSAMVPKTLSLAYRIGRRIDHARQTHADPVAAVIDEMNGFELLSGKIIDVARRTTAGFVRGQARIDGVDRWRGQQITLDFQNEHLLARRNDHVVASTPDLICVLDSDTAEPVTTESMRYGQRVSVLGVPCLPRWRRPDGLALVGPRYFGYDHDYVAVEQIADNSAIKA